MRACHKAFEGRQSADRRESVKSEARELFARQICTGSHNGIGEERDLLGRTATRSAARARAAAALCSSRRNGCVVSY